MTVCNVRALEVAATRRSELMSLVYRIQSKQDRTRGAYNSHTKHFQHADVVNRMTREHDNDQHDKHPAPHRDVGITVRNPNEFCGCATAADLLRWFKGLIPHLLRVGYEIVALHDVTIMAVGEYQVLFRFNT